ncbi:efflux RND transporter periplasmic adaptor subunit [Dyadobacter arcticus]|uniref:Multidrug efflux pump subunit AcrA (Membrane-fusion protein) n=1 Tax=Dyadobacter arcticus TaxID=1078754 RepID=A0ABX0UIG0_9BACT|nr:efflux RND transporter periplasmic adaptor subunit [Dyadobacter arcticus]NIJ52288.1 multidrug efflux pump subunit AcrA (membrane-fusion protein) [Dyadobacter arcticus]
MRATYLLLTGAMVLSACNKESETYTVTERPLNEAVYASGEIFPEEYEYIQTNNSERIMKILVAEGDLVKKGDLLVVLGTPSQATQQRILTDEITLARGNAAQTSAPLAEIQEKIRLAKQKYEHEAQNAQRYKELAIDKAVSQKDADDAALNAETSLSEYKNLKQQFFARQKELSGKVLSTTNQMAQFSQVREGKQLHSNLTGKVYSVNQQEGSLARPGEAVLLTGTANKFKLELLVDERDISKVKLGQKVLFETDAFGGKQFLAAVSKIIPVLQKENRSFKVEASVTDSTGFFPQSSVEASIMIRENSHVLVIPNDYLTAGDSVFVKSGKENNRVGISTGIRSQAWTEVTAGLKKGVIIVKP